MKNEIKQLVKKIFLSVLIASVIFSGIGNYLMPDMLTTHAEEAEVTETVIDPLAKYEFQDATNPGKDTMGNYDLVTKVSDGREEGNVAIDSGVATFDGSAALIPSSNENDISEDLESFTVAFEIKTPETPAGSWSTPVGFGWNDWTATKWGNFHIAGNDTLLRFSTHSDGSSDAYWGSELGRVSSGKYSKVVLSAQLGKKIAVYLDGAKVYEKELPSDYSLQDSSMRFAIGGSSCWGNVYDPFIGSLTDVRVYDFAFNEEQIIQYLVRENVYEETQVELGDVINPLAKYEFQDVTNPGKDTMGNYDLVTRVSDGREEGNVAVNNGIATFDGSAGLIPSSNEDDISEDLESFTVAFEIQAPETPSGGWSTPIGFGWNDWTATKWGNFHIAPGDASRLLRFSTHSDGSSDAYWGSELGTVSSGQYSKVVLTAQLGGKMTVYLNGIKKYAFDLPADYSLEDANMRFAIGGSSNWGNIYDAFVGSLSDVRVYDFAFDEEQIVQYLTLGNIYEEKQSEPQDPEEPENPEKPENPEELGVVVDPLAKYEFQDATNPGKDTMGKYDLVTRVSDGHEEGNVTVNSGVAIFNGSAGLIPDSNENDISEDLESFTVAFDIQAPEAPSASWSTPVGFGWNDWTATKWGNFHIAPGDASHLLRFSTNSDGNENQYWGKELGTLSNEQYSTVILSAQVGGKMTIYVDGVQKYTYDLLSNYSLKDTNMRFALGCSSAWGNAYDPFIGSLSDVRVYDFAFNETQIQQYLKHGNVYTNVYAMKSVTDFTKSIKVPVEATDAEILAYAPETSTIKVTMTDSTVKEAVVRWSSVESVNGEKCLAGEITTLANPNGVKAYGKVTFVKNTKVLLPIALYEFNDASNPGKDSMGNYDLNVAYAENYNESNGGVKASNGIALFDGTAGLISSTEDNDLSEDLKSFTMTYTIKTSGSYPQDWSVPMGFGWDDWEPKDKWFTFHILNNSTDLRFSLSSARDKQTGSSNVDNNKNQWWGAAVGDVSDERTVTVTVAQGGNIVVYLDGVVVNTYKTPAGFLMKNSAMQFAIGCCGSWGAMFNPFVGEISNVAIYDVALTEQQVKILSVTHEIRTNVATDAYISSVSSKPNFKGGVTKTTLTSSMTVKEMFAALNQATVKATLSDNTIKNLDIVWTQVEKRGDVYNAIGYARTTNQGILSVVNTVPIKCSLRVHTFDETTYEWSDDYSTCTATRVSKLDNKYIETETVNATVETFEATCSEDSKTVYTAVFLNRGFDTQISEVVDTASGGHKYRSATYEWSDDHSMCTATIVCSVDESHVLIETAYSTIEVNEGNLTYKASFENDLFETQTYSNTLGATVEDTSYLGVIIGAATGIIILAAGAFIFIKRKNSKGVVKKS